MANTRAHGRGQSGGPSGLRLIGLGILVLAGTRLIAFIIENPQTVRISFVFGHVSLSLVWVMIICAVLGALLAWGIPWFSRRDQGDLIEQIYLGTLMS